MQITVVAVVVVETKVATIILKILVTEHYISFQFKFYKTSGLQYTHSIYLL